MDASDKSAKWLRKRLLAGFELLTPDHSASDMERQVAARNGALEALA
jgi:hypothetical protein